MGVLTKYDQIEPIYLLQSVVTFIYLHSVYSIPCTGRFKIIVGVYVTCNFQIGNNKTKLLTEYESVTQDVLLSKESILENAK
jgi:hypothetical protein